MSFNYTSPSDIRLTATEEQLLEKIDNFQYPLHGFSDIGGIHNGLRGDVVLSNQRKSRHYSYEMTVAECMAKINELDTEIQKINDKLSTLHTRYKEARNNHDDDKANRLEEEMGYLGRNRQGLESTKEVYQEAICNGKCRIEGDTDILGEYDSTSNQVILYYKSISSKELLAVVYVHEMMHAYLDGGGITLPEIEEPIVEYAMLNFFKDFDKTICAKAENHVQEKQQVLGIAHYGFGHCIFMNQNRVDWLNDYLSTKPRIMPSSPEVKIYLDFWRTGLYPIGQEQAFLQALYDTMHTIAKTMIVKNRYAGVKIRVKTVLQKLQSIGTLPKTIALSDETQFGDYLSSRPSINGGYGSYMNSIKTDCFNELLDKHELPKDIYVCQDIDKLIDVLAELYDKPLTTEAKDALKYGSRSCGPALCYFIIHLLRINGVII